MFQQSIDNVIIFEVLMKSRREIMVGWEIVETREFEIVENKRQAIVCKSWRKCSAGVSMYRQQ